MTRIAVLGHIWNVWTCQARLHNSDIWFLIVLFPKVTNGDLQSVWLLTFHAFWSLVSFLELDTLANILNLLYEKRAA